MEVQPMTSRRGQPAVEVLRPVKIQDAPKRSLSAKYGTGPQPLHTDGAHLATPPDIVVLYGPAPSPVPTMLWRHDYWPSPIEVRDELAHGLFSVDDGMTRFLAPAYAGSRHRFDPGCMSPADSRARRVVDYFDGALASATRFEWTEVDQVLVIDNRTVLHARGDARADPERELLRLMFRIEKDKKW